MRFANGDFDRLPSLARELGALKPRVIVAAASAVDVVRQSFPDLPLVFTAFAADPIAFGLVESYVRPGGMATGNVMNAIGGEEAMTQKRIGLFKELVPSLKRIGMIATQNALVSIAEQDALRKVSDKLGFEFALYPIQKLDDLESAFASGLRDDVSAFYISGETLLFTNMSRVMPFRYGVRKAHRRRTAGLGTCRPSDVLFNRPGGRLSPRRRLCSKNSAWRQARRSPHQAGEQI